MVDVALVEGVLEEGILTVKREKIKDKTMQSIKAHGWLPDMFQQIIRGAKDFLQEMIFKFKLPPKPVPKIDLQEWNDMRKLMEKLQKKSQAMKFTISSLKKQLSIRTVEKGKHTGKIAPLSARKQATAKTDSKEKINRQRTMRKVEQKMKKTIFEEMGGTYVN